MNLRYGHVAIRARDIEESARFYREVMGMEEAFRMYNTPDGGVGTVYMILAPGQFLEIFRGGTEMVEQTDKTIGVVHLCFEVEDIGKAQEELRAKGAPIDQEVKLGHSRCLQFWTHDPDGNKIELMELPPDSMQAEANRRFGDL